MELPRYREKAIRRVRFIVIDSELTLSFLNRHLAREEASSHRTSCGENRDGSFFPVVLLSDWGADDRRADLSSPTSPTSIHD